MAILLFFIGIVLFGPTLGRFVRVIGRMQVMSKCEMGVMSSLLVVTAGMMLGRLFVMEGRLFMVFRRFSMMLYSLFGRRFGRFRS